MAQEAAPSAHVVHRTARRMRLKVPSRRHDPAFFAHLEKRLAVIPRIESALVTPETASVLLNFAEGDGSGIAAALDTLGLVSVVEPGAGERPSAGGEGLQEASRAAPRAQSGGASGRVDRRALAFTVFVLLLLRQLLKGGWLAPGLALAWLLLELLNARTSPQRDPLAPQRPADQH